MHVEPKELEEYLTAALGAIAAGVEKSGRFTIKSPVEFDLAVTNKKGGEGKLKIFVVDASAKVKTETVSKIKFKVDPKKIRVSRKTRD